MEEYDIIRSNNTKFIIKKMKELLKDRWEPIGSIVISNNPDTKFIFYQSIRRKGKKIASKRFVPPKYQEVLEYLQAKNSPVDPIKFYGHYKANGWKIGKASVQDWKACVKTWERGNSSQGSRSEPPRSVNIGDQLKTQKLPKL